jgi:pantoate--beta-alanine ligase
MALQVIRGISQLRSVLNKHRFQGESVALVPTMGNLHEGHMALIREAHNHGEVVVASIFVNPLQFGLNEDWDQYPRTFESDVAKLNEEHCHYLFFPTDEEMYPNGMESQTRVFCPTMTDVLCGATRPGHFEGVTTVVTKLFHIVDPDVAIFGEKDWQQLAVIRRMVADLCMRVKIIGAPIARDHDGLALSSRNAFITSQERPKANQLNKSLEWAKSKILDGERDYGQLEAQAKQQILDAGFRPDYFSVCNAQNLTPALDEDTDLAILGALFTEGARLIDNVRLKISR